MLNNEERAEQHLYHHVHMSVSMLGLFIAYSSMQNLMSSLTGAVGYWSLATIYIFLCISSILVGPVVVTYLKPKMSLIVGSSCYVSFIIANKWPSAYTLLPTAALLGIGGSILWTAQGTYLTHCACNYALKKKQSSKSAMGTFNGIFFAIFQVNQIVGNLIAGLILDGGIADASIILAYVYIGAAGLSFCSFWFLRNEEPPPEEGGEVQSRSISQKVFRAILQLRDGRLLLLLPIIFYSGMEQGFIFGSYTSDIVGKTIGKGKIGFVMTAFGAVDVAGSYLLGKFADQFGTHVLVIIGFIAHVVCLGGIYSVLQFVGLDYFNENPWLLYLGAGLWGLGDAAWNTFPNIMFSVLFTDDAESAFANLKFWQSLGTVLPFAMGAYLHIEVKVVAVFVFLWIGISFLVYLQIIYKIFNVRKAHIEHIETEESTSGAIAVN